MDLSIFGLVSMDYVYTALLYLYFVLALIFLFGLTIFVHEFGHFITAYFCGLVIDTFSIGFGPAIWKRKIKGIDFKIGCIPFGGYVALPQLDPTGMSTIQGEPKKDEADKKEEAGPEDKKEERPRELPPVAPWKKIIVAFAGGLGNVLFAVLLAWMVYWSPNAITAEKNTNIGFVDTDSDAYRLGIRDGDEIVSVNGERVKTWYDYAVKCALIGEEKEVSVKLLEGSTEKTVKVKTKKNQMEYTEIPGLYPSSICIIGSTETNSPAAKAGIKPLDVIRTLDGVKIRNPKHFTAMIAQRTDVPSVVGIERSGKIHLITVTPTLYSTNTTPRIGIAFEGLSGMPWMQYKDPWKQLEYDATGIFRLLKGLANREERKQVAQNISGPIPIFLLLWLAIQMGIVNALGFIRFLNINLAIMNLLPIPVLDGGHIVFSLYEWVTGRKCNGRFMEVLVNVFAVLLISLMVLVSFRDVMRLPKWFKKREEKKKTLNEQVQSANSNLMNIATNPVPDNERK